MKLAFLLESLDFQSSGAARAVARMAAMLQAELNCQVELYGPKDRFADHELTRDLKIYQLSLNQSLGKVARFRELANQLPAAARAGDFDKVIACGKFADCDVLWSHNGVHEANLQASAFAGRSSLYGRIALWAKRLRGLEQMYANLETAARERFLNNQLQIIALSQKVRSDYQRFWHIDSTKAQSINVVGNLATQQSQSQTASAKSSDGILKCLFVAMNPRLKGARELLHWRRKNLGARMEIDFYGTDPGRLSAGDRYCGLVNPIPFQHYHLLLLPSHYDPCSLITLEAMAHKIPVLTTPANGAAEISAFCQFPLANQRSQLSAEAQGLSYFAKLDEFVADTEAFQKFSAQCRSIKLPENRAIAEEFLKALQ